MKSINWSVMLAASVLVAGCNAIGGRTWIPNAPGDVPRAKEEAVAPTPAPRRAAAAPRPAEPEPTTSPFRTPPGAPAVAAHTPAPSTPATAPAVESTAVGGGYTQATRYGDLVFVSGQIAIDPRTNQFVGEKVEDQTRQVMENIRQVLEAHRLNMANVVSVTVYLKDLGQFRGMNDVYETYFRGALPARSVVEVARLPRGALVEISVIAGR